MTATLADPVSEVVAAAERLLTRRTGAAVTLVDPVDLGGSGRTIVVRVRVAENPFSLPRTLVLKQVHGDSGRPRASTVDSDEWIGESDKAFLREAVSYQFATALAKESRPGAELLASDLKAKLLVLSDLGDASAIGGLLVHSDADTVTNTLMAMAQALGRMHAATVGREEDFIALSRRADVPRTTDAFAARVADVASEVPQVLSEQLRISVSDDVIDHVERAAKLFQSGSYRAFSPVDLCPDNILINDEGVRFLDYEWGGFRDAMLDIAYALTSFPGCLCSVDLDDKRSQAMIDAWRAEVVGIWPSLADDAVLASRMLEAQLIWVWLSTSLFLQENLERIAAVREHALSVPRLEALSQRWAQLECAAVRAGNEVIADHAAQVCQKLHG
ncbi:MAG: phosphotransferase [Rhodococcus sp.]|nr:phosphotransferase [Rhodococcus sp. (in: high G+C Gram-positive bacteria)]